MVGFPKSGHIYLVDLVDIVIQDRIDVIHRMQIPNHLCSYTKTT